MNGIISDLIVTKATELLKLFLIEAVPLDFLLALPSPLLKKVLGTNLRMKIKHAIRRRKAFLKGWTFRLAKTECKMHCFRPLWTTDEPECVLCSFCVKWEALFTEVCKPKRTGAFKGISINPHIHLLGPFKMSFLSVG